MDIVYSSAPKIVLKLRTSKRLRKSRKRVKRVKNKDGDLEPPRSSSQERVATRTRQEKEKKKREKRYSLYLKLKSERSAFCSIGFTKLYV